MRATQSEAQKPCIQRAYFHSHVRVYKQRYILETIDFFLLQLTEQKILNFDRIIDIRDELAQSCLVRRGISQSYFFIKSELAGGFITAINCTMKKKIFFFGP